MTIETTLESIRQMIRAGQIEEAKAALDGFRETEDNLADMTFLRGLILRHESDREGSSQAFERVFDIDPDHTDAAFHLALLADQAGDEDLAFASFEQCAEADEAPVNAVMNLALLCEERGELERAEQFLCDILAAYPNHDRAKRFLRSVKSSYNMLFDELTQRERERHHAVLDMPVSDFELSVRSRNCLKQMNIRTLGDLLRTTEYELLSYKNFGETSLNEIKTMLCQKQLALGQSLQLAEPVPGEEPPQLDTDVAAVGQKPISELELSVRSRKALQRLGVITLGELAMRSEAELLNVKNFGLTSMTEIKHELAKFGLSFRVSAT